MLHIVGAKLSRASRQRSLSAVALALCTAATCLSSPGPQPDDRMERQLIGDDHPVGLLSEWQAGWPTRTRRGLQAWRSTRIFDNISEEREAGSYMFQDPDNEPSSRPVITILDPYPGAVFREYNDVEISFTVEGLGEGMGAEPTAVVSTVCHCPDCTRDGWRMNNEADIKQAITGPLPLLCSAEKTCEQTVRMASLPNGLYEVAVGIDYRDGRGQTVQSSWSTFRVDVDVELHRVLEEDGIEGGGGRIGRHEDMGGGEFSEEELKTVARCEEMGLKARQKPAHIFDGFTYNGEIDLLEVRAEEFGDLVTSMVLVESTHTFQGHVKELLYPSQAHRLSHAMRQKVQHVVEDFSELDAPISPFARENKQRDSILKGLSDARGHDIVLISDVDEIVNRDTILLLRVCHDFWAVIVLWVLWCFWLLIVMHMRVRVICRLDQGIESRRMKD